MDLLEELGAFAFASRLKRLSDRLKAEATTVYHHQGVDFNDSWFQVGYLLSRKDLMGITEIAKALGISRPAVSQMGCVRPSWSMRRKGGHFQSSNMVR